MMVWGIIEGGVVRHAYCRFSFYAVHYCPLVVDVPKDERNPDLARFPQPVEAWTHLRIRGAS